VATFASDFFVLVVLVSNLTNIEGGFLQVPRGQPKSLTWTQLSYPHPLARRKKWNPSILEQFGYLEPVESQGSTKP